MVLTWLSMDLLVYDYVLVFYCMCSSLTVRPVIQSSRAAALNQSRFSSLKICISQKYFYKSYFEFPYTKFILLLIPVLVTLILKLIYLSFFTCIISRGKLVLQTSDSELD